MLGTGIEARSSVSDDSLIRAAQGGDMDAFGVLYERYRNPVYVFVARSVRLREDAEDITLDTFARAWSSLPTYRGDGKLLSWLCSIAVNQCRDLARKAPRTPGTLTDAGLDIEQLIDAASAGDGPESRSVMRSVIAEALEMLPVTHRLLVILCDVEGHTAAEAAGIVGCTVISARVRLFRARKKLRGLLAHLLEVE